MEKLKVKVGNEAESKEVQELFFELGYVWHDTKCKTQMRYVEPVYYSSFDDMELACDVCDVNHKHKEITLPELRDMVVLRRNDVGDATHTDGHYSFYVGKDKNYFFSSCDKAWRGTWKNVEILKPIEKTEMKEYLVKSQDGNWREETTLTGDPADTVIEIPAGAELAVDFSNFYGENHISFYKRVDDFLFVISQNYKNWYKTEYKCINDIGFNDFAGILLWQRNQEPKQAEFLVKTDSGYVLQVLDENAGGSDVVRVPDGADTFAGDDNCHYFWQHRSGKKHLLIWCGSSLERYPQWVECEDSADEWLSNFDGDNSLRILWQREISAEEFKSKLPESTFKDFKQPVDLPFLDNGIDIGVENLPDFTPEFPSEKEIKTDFPLNCGDVNYRVAKAFNEIRGTDLTEDDLDYLRKLIDLTVSHYGERK